MSIIIENFKKQKGNKFRNSKKKKRKKCFHVIRAMLLKTQCPRGSCEDLVEMHFFFFLPNTIGFRE